MFFRKSRPPEEHVMILAKEELTAQQAGYSTREVSIPSGVFEGKSFNTRTVQFVICLCGCDEQTELTPVEYENDSGKTEIAPEIRPIYWRLMSYEQPKTFASFHGGRYLICKKFNEYTAYEIGIIVH